MRSDFFKIILCSQPGSPVIVWSMDYFQVKDLVFGTYGGAFESYLKREFEKDLSSVDVFAFGAFPDVEIESEMSGESRSLMSLALMTGKRDATAFAGVTVRAAGLKSLSVAAAHKGKLYDIADRTLGYDEDYELSGRIKVYNLRKSVIGLLIDTDVLSPVLWEKLNAKCDVVLNVSRKIDDDMRTVIETLSSQYSLPCLCVSEDSTLALGLKQLTPYCP